MAKLENNAQYEWAVARVEELLPLVDEDTPRDDPAFIELSVLSNLVADYSDEHFDIGEPSLAEMIRLRMYEMGHSQYSQPLSTSCRQHTEMVQKILSPQDWW